MTNGSRNKRLPMPPSRTQINFVVATCAIFLVALIGTATAAPPPCPIPNDFDSDIRHSRPGFRESAIPGVGNGRLGTFVMAADGSLYTQASTGAVWRILPSGRVVKVQKAFASGMDQDVAQNGVWVEADGRVYYDGVNKRGSRVILRRYPNSSPARSHKRFVFTANREDGVWQYTSRGFTRGDGQYYTPKDVNYTWSGVEGPFVSAPDGGLWFAVGADVAHMRPDGTFEPAVATSRNYVQDIAVGADGSVWVTGSGNNGLIDRIAPDGKLQLIELPCSDWPGSNIYSMVTQWLEPGPDGSMWFTVNLLNPTDNTLDVDMLARVRPDGTRDIRYAPNKPVVGGIDGTERLFQGADNKLWNLQSLSDQAVSFQLPETAPPLPVVLADTKRIRQGVIAHIRCIGTPGRVCSGKLSLKLHGRSISKSTYLLPAASAAAGSQTRILLKVPRRLKKQKRFTVVSPSGASVRVR